MARKTVLVSDITRNEIEKPANIKVMIEDAVWVIDADADEQAVLDLVEVGRKQGKRGRKPTKKAS
jgi:hypothetical protein